MGYVADDNLTTGAKQALLTYDLRVLITRRSWTFGPHNSRTGLGGLTP
jgi:hypothetical protein